MSTVRTASTHLMSCPKCGHETADFPVDAGVAPRACTHCKGMWFERGQLAMLVGTAHDVPQFGVQLISSKPTSITCPSCRRAELMEMPYVLGEPLVVDWCRACGGVWLDAGEITELSKLAADLRALAEGRPRPSTLPPEALNKKSRQIPYDNIWVNAFSFPFGLVWGWVALTFAATEERWNEMATWFQQQGEVIAAGVVAVQVYVPLGGYPDVMRSGVLTEIFLGCLLVLGFYCELPRRSRWDMIRFFSLAAGSLLLLHAIQTDFFLGRIGLVLMGLAYLSFLARTILRKVKR